MKGSSDTFFTDLLKFNYNKDTYKDLTYRFTNFKKSRYRIELLNSYLIPGDDYNSYILYAKGKTRPQNLFADWYKSIAKDVNDGKDLKRVRLVEYPISTYVIYSIKWAYVKEVELGAHVKFLFSRNFDELTPLLDVKVPMLKDYWLIDNEHCYLMEYDFLGRFYGTNKVPDKYVYEYSRYFTNLYTKGVDLTDAIKVIGT